MRFRLASCVAVAVVALAAAACGSDDPVTVMETTDPEALVEREESPTTSTAAADPTETGGTDSAVAVGPGDVPDLQMINVHTGATLDLQSVVDGQSPLLFWFWAPH